MIFFFLIFAIALSGADAGACKPVTLVMTRASGSPMNYTGGKWVEKYPLSTVNMANIRGALKYIISETIDLKSGYTNTSEGCFRKNKVSFVRFYKFTFCNSDASMWYFNKRNGAKNKYKLGEFGAYATMDMGVCHGNEFCKTFHGVKGKKDVYKPNLGPFVGYKDESIDVRNPTPQAAWYSVPGECPLLPWAEKTKTCKKDNPSGRCPKGSKPDGKTCTWDYEVLGEVVLDELVGITKMKNNATGKPFKNNEEFCKAGGVEFSRHSKTYDFVDGLDFWKNPLNGTANIERVQKLLDLYKEKKNNKPLDLESIAKSNPACYTSDPRCNDGKKSTCGRDESMMCVPCSKLKGGCTEKFDPKLVFPKLAAVEMPEDASVDGTDDPNLDDKKKEKLKKEGNTDDKKDESNSFMSRPSIILFVAAFSSLYLYF